MSDDGPIDLAAERSKRIHELNDRRLEAMRQAFAAVLPLPGAKKKSAQKKRKR